MDEVQQGLRYLFQTDSKYTLCASGTGHSGMEMAIANLVERGETVVVGNNGIWVRARPGWLLSAAAVSCTGAGCCCILAVAGPCSS
jgi:hypothetical protein